MLAAGRRRLGGFILTLLLLGILLLGAILVIVPPSRLAGLAGKPQVLGLAAVALALAAVTWLIIAVASHRALEPRGLRAGQRLAGAVVVVTTASLVVGPLAVASRYAFVQQDLVGHLFSEDGNSLTTPDLDAADPWKDKPRVNVLLLGSDYRKGVEGIRPDTIILASIDTHSGETVMFSLPRNLQRMPFPEDSPLHDLYPNGYRAEGLEEDWQLLNAVYKRIPEAHPEIFDGVDDPGADATKLAVSGALGLDVDYYAMVNLEGFRLIVDALGGIEVNVNRRLPIGNKQIPGGGCTKARGWIEQGPNQHLDGKEALWFARSRCGSDDYERMQRQRCVIDAMVKRADPVTLLTRYQQLASATKDIMSTDIPQDMLPAFIDLALAMKDAKIASLTFEPRSIPGFRPSRPDYDDIHKFVDNALNPKPKPTATSSDAPPSPSQTGSTAPKPTPTATPTQKPGDTVSVEDACAYNPET